MNQGSSNVAEHAPSGRLMRLVADGLEQNGFLVRLTGDQDRGHLTVPGLGARCELSVTDGGDVALEYSPPAGGEVDPKQIADLATVLLTGRREDYPRRGCEYDCSGVTFKGLVRLEVKARGLDVGLEVYADEDSCEVVAEIVVTNPGTARVARVRVTDDGAVLWERDYSPEAATITWEPEYSAQVTDPGKVADSIVATVTQAISPPTDVMIDAL